MQAPCRVQPSGPGTSPLLTKPLQRSTPPLQMHRKSIDSIIICVYIAVPKDTLLQSAYIAKRRSSNCRPQYGLHVCPPCGTLKKLKDLVDNGRQQGARMLPRAITPISCQLSYSQSLVSYNMFSILPEVHLEGTGFVLSVVSRKIR